VRPPASPPFWRFAETVEKGPLLAGFFVFTQTDPGLRSRKCGNFALGLWSKNSRPWRGSMPMASKTDLIYQWQQLIPNFFKPLSHEVEKRQVYFCLYWGAGDWVS
jgi:hypothetical protein